MTIMTQFWLHLCKQNSHFGGFRLTDSFLIIVSPPERNKQNIPLHKSLFWGGGVLNAAIFKLEWLSLYTAWRWVLQAVRGGVLCAFCSWIKKQRWVGEDTWAWVEAVKREEVGIVRPKRTRAIIISWELCMKGAEWIVRSKHWGQQMLRGGGVPLHCQLV